MKVKFEIVGLTVLNREDAYPPTKLTVSYKGWWHLTRLHVPLALDKLRDASPVTRKAGHITLVQQFPTGKAPVFTAKGRDKKLEIRLLAGTKLRTRAKVSVGDLISCTAERLMEVPFEEKVGGKVASGCLSVAQISPVATPAPPPDNNSPSCSLAEHPTSSPPSQDCLSLHGGTGIMEAHTVSSHNDGGLHHTATEVVYQAPKFIQEQITAADSEDDFRRLWVKVFGGHNEPLNQQEHDGEDAQESPQITPGDCDDDFVRLWSNIFGDYSDSTHTKGIKQSPQIPPVDCDGHSFHLWKWSMGLSALFDFVFRLLIM